MLLRGDGEIDSITDGRCERCGGAVDQAGACHPCDSETPQVMKATAPEATVAAAVEPQLQATGHSTDATRSDAVRRFGWDPSTDEVVEPLPASEPEPRKTVSEASVPAPELEALFAALESSPIRIKPREPETPAAAPESIAADSVAGRIVAQAPAIAPPFARPFETTSIATPAADAETELSLNTIDVASIAPQTTIALKPVATFDAPVTPEPTQTIEETPIVAPREVPDVPEIDQLLASLNVHSAIAAVSEDAWPEANTTPAIDVQASAALEVRGPDAPIAPIALKVPPPIETPTIVTPPPPAFETPRALDLPMPIATVADEPLPAPEPVAPPPPAAAPTATKAAAVTAQAAKATPSIRWKPLLTAGATVAILAVIGVPLSKLWLERTVAQPGVQPGAVQPAPQPRPQHAPAARVTPPAPPPTAAPAASPSPAPHVAPPPVAPAVSTASNATVIGPPRTAATERPRTVLLSPDAQVPPRPARPAAPVTQPVAPPAPPAPQVAALAPAITAPTVSALPTAEAEPTPPPAPVEVPTAAAGPFFELNDVDSPPRVAARVDMVLPASLEGQSLNEIVVVRVLVSQTGRPALVSLLRHSKAGLALDEAVIAAVKQWTFTPALKRGQRVSCFYHAAVPVSQR